MENIETKVLTRTQKAFSCGFVGVIAALWIWMAMFLLKMTWTMVRGLIGWLKENG